METFSSLLRACPFSVSSRAARLAGVAALVASSLAMVSAGPAAATHGPAAWTIGTAAGNGSNVVSGDGGPATAAGIGDVQDVAGDDSGNLYIATSTRVRKVDTAGTITTVAGTGVGGFSGDGGPATAARIVAFGITVDGAGNIYIAASDRVRKVDTAGIITTVAGNGQGGMSGGDGGPATAATLESASGMDVDNAGNLYIADAGLFANRVRKVDTAGVITTVAGTGTPGSRGDGRKATAAQLWFPQDVAVDAAGNLYIADSRNNKVRKVDAAGIMSTLAGTGAAGFDGDGGPATAAVLRRVRSVEVSGGDVLLTDSENPDDGNHVVRRVDAAGIIDTIAGQYGNPGVTGDGGPSTAAMLRQPRELAMAGPGHLYVNDGRNRRIRLVETSHVWAATSPRLPGAGQAFTYVLTVSGLPAPAAGVSLTAALSPAVAFSSVTTTHGSCAGGATVTCSLGTVTAGDVATVRVTVNALAVAAVPLAVSATADDPAALAGLGSFTTTTKVSGPGCGQSVTASVVLATDIGPCAGNGLIIRASAIDVDLNGHTVSGWDGPADGTSGGVRLAKVSRVTLHDGTVTGFDAGVVVNGGRNNTVRNLEVLANVGPDNAVNADLSDGIVVFDAVGTRILDNHVAGNGVYDGIGLWGAGTVNSVVQRNVVEGSVGPAAQWSETEFGHGIIANGADGQGSFQSGNVFTDNVLRNNTAAGISNVNNVKGTIARNLVEGNGFGSVSRRRGPGIGVSTGFNPRSFDTQARIEANQVHGNAGSGIEINNARANTIVGNDASGNALTPPPTSPPGQLRYFDLQDTTANCSTNTWSGNTWGSGGYSPACTTTGGAGPIAAATSGASTATTATSEGPALTRRLPG